MMTIGRLRAIESYWARRGYDAIVCVGKQHTDELIAEVKRLREWLEILKIRCGDCVGMAAKNDHPESLHVLIYVANVCAEALREPDLGPPDIVLVRPHPFDATVCPHCHGQGIGDDPVVPVDPVARHRVFHEFQQATTRLHARFFLQTPQVRFRFGKNPRRQEGN